MTVARPLLLVSRPIGYMVLLASMASPCLVSFAPAEHSTRTTAMLAAQDCAAPPSGLVSWWPADGNYDDISGSNNGTSSGTVTFGNGKVGQAFGFNASGIAVASSSSLNVSAITIAAWVKPTSFPNAYQTVVRRPRVGGSQYVLAVSNGGEVNFNIGDIVAGQAGSAPLGVWTHIAGTYDVDTLRIYVNGAQVAAVAGTSSIPSSNSQLGIGKLLGSSTRDFYGMIDEVMLFDRALTGSEIQSFVSADSAGMCRPSAGVGALLYSVDLNSDSVVLINTETGAIHPLAHLGADMVDTEVAVSSGAIYVLNSTGVQCDLLTLHSKTFGVLSSQTITEGGFPIGLAEALAVHEGSLIIGFRKTGCGVCSDAMGFLSEAATISQTSSLSSFDGNADCDALASGPGGTLRWWDASVGLNNLRLIAVAPPGSVPTYQVIGQEAPYESINSITYTLDGKLWGMDPNAQRLHILSPTTGARIGYRDYDNHYNLSGLSLAPSAMTSVESPATPRTFALFPGRPNPFNPSTRIEFDLPGSKAARVRANIYTVQGRRVRRLLDANKPPGRHSVTWDGKDDPGRDAASGVYYFVLRTADGSRSIKLVLAR